MLLIEKYPNLHKYEVENWLKNNLSFFFFYLHLKLKKKNYDHSLESFAKWAKA